MRAIISGRTEKAIILANGGYALLNSEGSSSTTIASDIACSILRASDDWDEIEAGSLEDVRDAVVISAAQSHALDCCLFLFDAQLSSVTKEAAADTLDGLLGVPGVEQYLLDIFLAKPLPITAELKLEEIKAFRASFALLSHIINSQSVVNKVRTAWASLPFEIHIRHGKTQVDFESACLRNGVFRKLVNAFSEVDGLSLAFLTISKDPLLSQSFPGLNMLLSAWVSALKAMPGAGTSATRAMRLANRTEDGNERLQSPRDTLDVLTHKTIHEAYTAAISQIDRIVELAAAGKDPQAERILDELIAEQLRHESGESHAMRSLCNIAKQVRDHARRDFALKCLIRATKLGGDALAFQQLSAVLIDVEEFELAETSLNKAMSLTSQFDHRLRHAIWSSRIHLLESQYKFELALQAYNDIDPVYAGQFDLQRADTLRKMGRLNQSMRLYVSVLNADPKSDRALAGKAEIARRRGRPHKGIRHYLDIFRHFEIEEKSRPVYRVALGNLLRMSGQVDRARQIATEVLTEQPYNLHASLLLASLFGVEGKFDRALETLPRTSFPEKRIIESLLDASKGNTARANDSIRFHLEHSRLLLEERFMLGCTQIAVGLSSNLITVAGDALSSLAPATPIEKGIASVFRLHIAALRDEPIREPSRRYLLRDWRSAIDAIKAGDLRAATRFEIAGLLKCA